VSSYVHLKSFKNVSNSFRNHIVHVRSDIITFLMPLAIVSVKTFYREPLPICFSNDLTSVKQYKRIAVSCERNVRKMGLASDITYYNS